MAVILTILNVKLDFEIAHVNEALILPQKYFH